MGGGHSKKYLSESELSNEESDSEYILNLNCEVGNVPLDTIPATMVLESEESTDAALRSISLPIAENVITIDMVPDIEKELDTYEIVSLVYLLYDTCELALQDLQLLLATGQNSDLLHKWAKNEDYKGNKRWQAKLVEALCIIQNYKILRDNGFAKVDLISTYMPHRAETNYLVDRKRKAFYLIAEKLGEEPTTQFMKNMGRKLEEKKIAVHHFSENYLEMYFLFLEQIHLNIEDIKNTFKGMGLEECHDILNSLMPLGHPKTSLNTNPAVKPLLLKTVQKNHKPKERRKSTTRDTTYAQPRSVEDFSRMALSGLSGVSREGPCEEINGYTINPENPGTALIINQEEFYTELDPEYRGLLHEDNDRVKLETREGTMMDKKKLEHVFRRRGFQIIVKENLPHYEIINTINDVVKSISFESSLIVCILSHGDNGVVYGANSCKVDVNQIQNIICKRNRNLRGKPKVLILQSCQGKQCQKIDECFEEEGDLHGNAKDGPSTVPSTADLLTFWATIPGFAAIRNKYKGSWLIQELCDSIEQYSSRYHFLDICTKVNDKVMSREWKETTGTNIMTPMVVTTLRKPFYLPAPRNNP